MQGTPLRRAKIVCTIGPASQSEEALGALIDAGMDCARLNFSHGRHEDHATVFRTLRAQASRRGRAVAVLADLQGPKLRVGEVPEPGFALEEGHTLVFDTDGAAKAHQPDATTFVVTTSYKGMARDVKPGARILLDDGNLEVEAVQVEGTQVRTRVVQASLLTSRKGINLPGVHIDMPALTDKDKTDLEFALELGVDLVALSFVRTADDLERVREVMNAKGRHVPIVAKIEKPQAIDDLQSIVAAADGIMVARGDLGVEMGPETVPVLQKRIIEAANAHGKVVITATQMLDSMIRNARPTRAEASDVSNALLDGTDAVMLSGETAVGVDPAHVVETMDRIIRYTEEAPRYWKKRPEALDVGHAANAIASAVVDCSENMDDVRAIVTYTGSGGAARLVSGYRPQVPIIALTPEPGSYQALALYWGVTPVLFSPSSPGGESIFIDIDQCLIARELLARGDWAAIAFGYPLGEQKSVNLLKLHQVGEFLG